jgi:transposase-like protein
MNEPKLVTGDGALGAWAALRSVFPGTREQRCWVHYLDLRVIPSRVDDCRM